MRSTGHSIASSCHLALFKIPKRTLFIVGLSYKVPLEQVDQHIKAHREFLDKYYASNTFIMSGRKIPRTGGVIIAKVSDRATLEKIMAEDPFHQNNLADYTITEFEPSLCSAKAHDLIAADSPSLVMK